MAKPDHRPLLMRIANLLGTPGLLVEEFISPGKWDGNAVYGLWEKNGTRERITINPIPYTVQTVIHECLHSLHPAWSERYVDNRTKFLFNRMNDKEVQELYNLYQKRVTKRA